MDVQLQKIIIVIFFPLCLLVASIMTEEHLRKIKKISAIVVAAILLVFFLCQVVDPIGWIVFCIFVAICVNNVRNECKKEVE